MLETFMILELADIRIHPEQNAAFEEAIARGAPSLGRSLRPLRWWNISSL
jgi:hypothetical protein